MKTSGIFSLLVSLVLFNSGCDPERPSATTYFFKIKGTVNNTNESLSVFDTLKFRVVLPDTLFLQNAIGETKKEIVNSLQFASFGYRIFSLDTIGRKINPLVATADGSFKVNVNPGYTDVVNTPFLQTNSKPYTAVVNIVPQKKGIYYMEILPQAGMFKVNNNPNANNMSYTGVFKVNIDVADRHYNLLSTRIDNYAEWLSNANEKNAEGFETYVFRIN
jgi:hypothetical protein